MSQNEEVVVCKLPKELSKQFYRIKTVWHKICFDILVLDGDTMWSGKVTKDDVSSLSRQLSFEEAKYFQETKMALTSNMGAETFSYSMEGCLFLWKKMVGCDTKVKFGSVSLEQISVLPNIEDMIDILLEKNVNLQQRLTVLKSEKSALESSQSDLKRKLDEHTLLKAEMEQSLYSQFLMILNAKKKELNNGHDSADDRFGEGEKCYAGAQKHSKIGQKKFNPLPPPNAYNDDTESDISGGSEAETDRDSSPIKSDAASLSEPDRTISNDIPKRGKRFRAERGALGASSNAKSVKTNNFPSTSKCHDDPPSPVMSTQSLLDDI